MRITSSFEPWPTPALAPPESEISNLKSRMLLGLDLGTTNVKALVTDRAGRPLAHGSCSVPLFHVGQGGVEQDLGDMKRATLTAVREAVRSLDATGIEAVGVSSQGGAMQLLSPLGKPVGRVISWLDQRGRTFDDALTAELGAEWFRRRIGHGRSGMAIGQVLRLRHEQPQTRQVISRLGFVGDLLVAWLCGRAVHDGTSCGLTLLYNPHLRGYDPDLLRRLELEACQLPDLAAPRETAGGLQMTFARATGLRTGIPVSAAVHDQYASALGTGAVRPGMVMIGTGTAWVLLAVSDHLPAPVTDDAYVCEHLVDGLAGQILSLVNGGSALAWAMDLMGLASQDARELETLLASSPAGSNGLRFWPFLAPAGAPGLPPATRGRLSGLQLAHRRSHVARAVVEGLAFELNRHLDFLRKAGRPPRQLVLSGSAAASAATARILADVTALPLHCASAGEASLLGAAILARSLLEPQRSLVDLVDEMTSPPQLVEPSADAPFYQEQYHAYLHSLPGNEPHPS